MDQTDWNAIEARVRQLLDAEQMTDAQLKAGQALIELALATAINIERIGDALWVLVDLERRRAPR